jgi:hypothetical protein
MEYPTVTGHRNEFLAFCQSVRPAPIELAMVAITTYPSLDIVAVRMSGDLRNASSLAQMITASSCCVTCLLIGLDAPDPRHAKQYRQRWANFVDQISSCTRLQHLRCVSVEETPSAYTAMATLLTNNTRLQSLHLQSSSGRSTVRERAPLLQALATALSASRACALTSVHLSMLLRESEFIELARALSTSQLTDLSVSCIYTPSATTALATALSSNTTLRSLVIAMRAPAVVSDTSERKQTGSNGRRKKKRSTSELPRKKARPSRSSSSSMKIYSRGAVMNAMTSCIRAARRNTNLRGVRFSCFQPGPLDPVLAPEDEDVDALLIAVTAHGLMQAACDDDDDDDDDQLQERLAIVSERNHARAIRWDTAWCRAALFLAFGRSLSSHSTTRWAITSLLALLPAILQLAGLGSEGDAINLSMLMLTQFGSSQIFGQITAAPARSRKRKGHSIS